MDIKLSIYRYYAAILAIIMLFSACSDGNSTDAAPGLTDTALSHKVTFVIAANAGEAERITAENFCLRANTFANGAFTLSLSESDDPVADFISGNAGFMLLDSDAAERWNPLFGVCGESFIYGSYEDFSMSCNSAPVLKELAQASGANVFAAFYTGSDVFVGTYTLDKLLDSEKKDTEIKQTEKFLAVTSDESVATPGTLLSDVSMTALESLDSRVELLVSGDSVAEFAFEELHNMDFNKIMARLSEKNLNVEEESGGEDEEDEQEALGPPQSEEDSEPDEDDMQNQELIVTRIFHNAKPAWLIVAPSFYEDLSPVGQAAISEAAAYMTGELDGAYLDAEKELLDALESEGILVTRHSTSGRSKILRALTQRRDEAARSEESGELSLLENNLRAALL